MSKNETNGYKEIERVMLWGLLVDVGIFLLYLLFAVIGVTWMKVVLAVLAILVSGLGLGSLYLTGELFRRRSRYLVAGFGAVLVCLLVSLIANYPSPTPTLPTAGAFLPWNLL